MWGEEVGAGIEFAGAEFVEIARNQYSAALGGEVAAGAGLTGSLRQSEIPVAGEAVRQILQLGEFGLFERRMLLPTIAFDNRQLAPYRKTI